MTGLTNEAAKAAVRAAGLKLTTKEGKAMLASLMTAPVVPVVPVAETVIKSTNIPSIDWERACKTGGLFCILSELAEGGINPQSCSNWNASNFRSIFNALPSTEEQKIKNKFPLLF
jgi:hypothetical protein